MRASWFLLACVILIIGFQAHQAQAGARQISEHEGLIALVSDRPDWCQETVQVVVRSDSTSPFQGDRLAFLRLIAQVRLTIEEECPAAQALRVRGVVKSREVFEGKALRSEGWRLTQSSGDIQTIDKPGGQPDVASTSQTAPIAPPVAQANSLAQCDSLAAHPADPARAKHVRGHDDDHLDAANVIKSCGEAVNLHPDLARLHFQLGRGYWAADRYEEAIESFVAAGEMGHGGALAYLGDAALYGVAGLDPDPETAKGLFQRATKAGFKPAAAAASEIVAGVRLATQKQEASFEPEYHYAKIIGAFSSGTTEFPGGFSKGGNLLFVAFALNGVFHHCPDAYPNNFDLETAYVGAVSRKLTFFEAAALNGTLNNGGYDKLIQEGMDDGYALAYARGCAAQETKTFIKTAVGYFR